jgi:hypothetical protein
MDQKLLTENGWKAIALKSKIKDNGLQRALAAYEQLDDDECADRLKAIASVIQLATALKKVKEVAAVPAAVKYLAELIGAATSAQAEIIKAKAAADKAEAMTQKKAGAGAKKSDEDEDEEEEAEEEEDEEYAAKLLAAFQKLKGAKDVSYEFLVCDAKPVCGIMVAKKITPKHRQQLTEVTGGSKRFLPVGTCSFQDGKFTFAIEKPVTGLARKLQNSIKNFTGKKLAIAVGAESVGDDEEQPASGEDEAPQTVAPPKLGKAELAKAPNVWHSTRDILDKNIEALKRAVMQASADDHPDLIDEINENLGKLDGIMDKLDTKLADSLAKAYAAKDEVARKAELKNSKAILADYIKYVKSEPLIAHVDANPFGVKTNLKKVLMDSLTHMAQAIG